MEIYKFGGLALQNADSIKKVADFIRNYQGEKLIIVVSAIGKNTRLLCRYAHEYFNQHDEKECLYQTFSANHLKLIKELEMNEQQDSIQKANRLIKKLKQPEIPGKQDYVRFFDSVICNGELISSLIVNAFLEKTGISNTWIDIRNALITNNKYNAAEVNHEQSKSIIKKLFLNNNRIMITQGFIGRSEEGYSTTLGFEGSDYTAALLANYLDANKVTIWKDVPGIMSADPKLDPKAIKLDELTYDEVAEYTYAGAKVLHPKTIKPLKEKQIPLEVKSFLEPEKQGSIIHDTAKTGKNTVIIQKNEQKLIRFEAKDESFVLDNHLSGIHASFDSLNININLMHHSAIALEICTDSDPCKYQKVLEQLSKKFNISQTSNLELWTFFNCNAGIIYEKTQNKELLIGIKTKDVCKILCKTKTKQSL